MISSKFYRKNCLVLIFSKYTVARTCIDLSTYRCLCFPMLLIRYRHRHLTIKDKCPLLLHRTSHKVSTYKEYHSVCPSSELGLSQPLSRQPVFPSPRNRGEGAHQPAGGGLGGSPNSDEGHTLWYSLYVRTLWYQSNYFFSKELLPGHAMYTVPPNTQ